MAEYPAVVPCPCGENARRVIARGIQQAVDHVGDYNRTTYHPGTGQNFRNRAEMREYLDRNGLYEVGPEEAEAVERERHAAIEAKQDLGDAWDGDLPGRRERAVEEYRKSREASWQAAAEKAYDEMRQYSDDFVGEQVGALRASADQYVARGASVSQADVDVAPAPGLPVAEFSEADIPSAPVLSLLGAE